ncbi:MAG: hypothetical protein KA354_24295 [Phycisphaerae bacterium]|nr:hypothetical protein [Phycisphaerae bacterium]
MATRKRQSTRGMTWVRVLTQRDLDELRTLLTKGEEKRTEWEYKLYRDNVIISVPVIPWNPDTKKPDPSLRYMTKFLRVVPAPGGPFQLEYMRHTGQWLSMFGVMGDIKTIAKFIDEDPYYGKYNPFE